MRAKLLRDFHREILFKASLYVDHRQLLQFGLRLRRQLSLFTPNVRLLRVALRAHRNIFAHGHRHRPCNKTRHTGNQDSPLRRGGRRDTNHEACG